MLPIVGLVAVCAVVLWWSKELWLPTMIPAWRPKAERRQRGWATPSDLHRAGMVGAGYQVGVMRPGKTPVRVPDEMSALVVAPPGAWKTTRVAVPVLEGWAGPAVVTSTKRDLYDLTVQARGRRGPVYVFDPRGVTGQPSVGWNPVLGCADWTVAEETAVWLVEAARVEDTGSNAKFWSAQGRMLLAPLLFAAASTGRSALDILRWVQHDVHRRDFDPQDAVLNPIRAILDQLGDHDALGAWAAFSTLPTDTKGGVVATALTLFESYTRGAVRALTTMDPAQLPFAGGPGLVDFAALVADNATLYLVATADDQAQLRPVFEAFLASLMRWVADQFQQTGRPLEPRLLLLLDEAAHVAAPLHLGRWLGSYRGQGVTIMTVWQSLSQIVGEYGADRAKTVVEGHPCKLVLGGVADETTTRYVSGLVGQVDQVRVSTSQGAQRGSSVQVSVGQEAQIAPSAVRLLAAGDAIAVIGNCRPIRLRLPPAPWDR